MQDQGLEYAGFWARTGAAIIDTILIMLVTFPLLLSIYGWAYFDAEQTDLIAGPDEKGTDLFLRKINTLLICVP